MALKHIPSKPQLVKDFWPRFKRGAIVLIIVLQLLIFLALALILKSLGYFDNNPFAVAAALIAQSILGVIASVIVYYFVARPIKHLLAALVHVAGEPTDVAPPNPNETHFERNGFKPVLQTVYQLASNAPDPIGDGEKDLTPGAVVAEKEKNPKHPRDIIEAALDSTICGFVVMNSKREITYANKATPIKVDTNGVQSLDLLFSEHDTIEQWWDECNETAVHAEKTWARIPNKLPDQENRRFFDVIASYNKGTESEVVLSLIDRTHLYEINEQDLDFISFAAHELRGPITVIRGYIDVMQDELDGVLQEDQKELFRRMTVSANRLTGYVNNILNTARYDRRHLRMHLVETSVSAVYNIIKDDMALRATSQRRILSVKIPDGLPTIAADSTSLSEVIGNLIDNAIKYSYEGGTINVTALSRGDMVEISVEDHGIGMPSSVVSNLFQKFYRSHRSRETVVGSGIGLYISRAIVESHGGNIQVRSEDGKGSTFTVVLPTYKTVADKLKASNNGNEAVINREGSWIKNHTMFRG